MNRKENALRILQIAIEAAKVGEQQKAHHLLQQVVDADPTNEVAWLWLAAVAYRSDEALGALNRVEQLNPDHPRLAAARRWAQARALHAIQPSQTGEQSSLDPIKLAGSVLSSEVRQRDLQADTPTSGAVAVTSTQTRWLQRLLVGTAGVAVVLTIGLLVMAFWGWVSTVQAEPPLPPTPDNSQRVVALQPELNAALAESRWEDAVAVLQVMRALDVENQTLVRQLASVYYQLAIDRRDQHDLDGALAALDEALLLSPDDESVQQERRLLGAYRQGIVHHQAGSWQAAIEVFSAIRRDAPAYLNVVELLYSAYYNLGLSQQAAGDLPGAQASYQAATVLMPDEPLARQKADEVAWLLRPPTPTPLPTPVPPPTPTPEPNPQRIVVDVSEQRMYVYEGGNLIWKWLVSTGEPGRDTAFGNFAIQSKIEMAYASTWNLDMPYWQGIYWSGPLENGIHALPIQRATGYKLWDGYLGQRVSYGCVILSDENARTLFNWAKMGTPVIIQP